jgi:O-antigen ligase
MREAYKSIKILPIATVGAIIFLLYLSIRRPYLFDTSNLMVLTGLVVAGFIAAQYETHFWALLVAAFLWAGSEIPWAGAMYVFRWIILAIAALLALSYYGLRPNRIHFNYMHLLALFTVLAAFASGLVSVNPLLTSMKALSLAALFVYGSIGIRILWGRQPEVFLKRLCLSVEVLTYFTAACYAVSFEVWGNANSLGVITSIICWPILLWWFLIAKTRGEYVRSRLALAICALLLVMSGSRASMAAAFFSAAVLLISARRYRTLLAGCSVALFALTLAYLTSPERFQSASESLLYKTGERGHLLQSRQAPWEKSLASFRDHPWLGFGFGVAETSVEWHGGFHTPGFQTRERGSSYLYMLEGTGIAGTAPFLLLALGLILNCSRVFWWLRHTGSIHHPAVPAACLIVGALFHAAFEDWLLAVGYYMCVIFWSIALSLRDWMDCPALAIAPNVPAAPEMPISERSFALR